MSDEKDDLDDFARMFGAEPETPPEGLIPPIAAAAPPASPVPPVAETPDASAPAASDPLAWLSTEEPASTEPMVETPPEELPTAVLRPAGAPDLPTTAFPPVPPNPFVEEDAATTVFPGASTAGAAATLAAFPPSAVDAPALNAPAEAATTAFPTRRSVQTESTFDAESGGDGPDHGRRNLIILISAAAVLLILIIVFVIVLVGKLSSPSTAASPSALQPLSPVPTATRSSAPTPTATPTPTVTPTPTPTVTPTPTPAPTQTTAPPPPAATITAAVTAQPVCGLTTTTTTTLSIGYTVTNASAIRLAPSDPATTPSTVTADPSGTGTISGVPYTCGSGETYTLTAIGTGQQASATVTPAPTSG